MSTGFAVFFFLSFWECLPTNLKSSKLDRSKSTFMLDLPTELEEIDALVGGEETVKLRLGREIEWEMG